jgi:hypothetical protein
LKACLLHALKRPQRITPQARRIAKLTNPNVETGFQGTTSHHIAISGIVADATHHDDSARLGPVLPAGLERRPASALHEYGPGDTLLFNGKPIQCPHLFSPVEVHW